MIFVYCCFLPEMAVLYVGTALAPLPPFPPLPEGAFICSSHNPSLLTPITTFHSRATANKPHHLLVFALPSNCNNIKQALVNMYMVQLARDHPELIVNAATPGFIKTDLTKPFEASGKTLDEMGAKSPAEGAKVLVHLATADGASSGWYFGSDLVRSPLDRYRGPGDPPYVGK